MLTCMICGKVTTQINHAHLKSHGMTSAEYKEMFPGAKMRIMSEKQKQQKREMFINMNQSEEFRQKNSEILTGKPKSENHKEALREAKANEDKKHRAKVNGDNRRGKKHTKETIETIAKNSALQKHPFSGKAGIRVDLGHNCRSTWEANFARILKLLDVKYQYEKTVWLKRDDGTDLLYMPDFYLPEYDSYVEIKGRWYDDAREKFELFKKTYPNAKMHLIELKQYSRYAERYKKKINEWE